MTLTSQIRYVFAADTSVTDGSGKTGLAFGDITAKYLIDGGTLTSLTTETITTLGTYQAPTSAAHIRIKELANTDPTKGIYEVHFHNTQLATGTRLWLFLSATGAKFQPLEIELIDISGRLPTALTAGGNIKADVLALSGDTTAADNAESYFDGTGYGIHLNTGTIVSLTSQTVFIISLSGIPAGDFSNTLNGTIIQLFDTELNHYCLRTIINSADAAGNVEVTLDSAPSFTVEVNDILRLFPSSSIPSHGTYGNAAIKGYVDDIGVAGAGLTAIGDTRLANLDAPISTVDTVVDAIKAKTDTIPANPSSVSDIPTALAIADAVWDEAIANHLTAGSTGAKLNTAGAVGDPWSTTLPGAYTAGQAGYILGNINDSNIGPGADLVTLHITKGDTTPIPDADVWITNTTTYDDVYAGVRRTDSQGDVQFMLQAGDSYYLWMSKQGYLPIEGSYFTAVAD